jgi:hypothetical protein
MTIMGAAAQMAPALLGARIRGERSVPWLYGLMTFGVALMTAGFLAANFTLVAVGGAGVAAASWWFVGILAATAFVSRRRPGVPPHIPVALGCLVFAVSWGTALAFNLRWGFWPALFIAHRGLIVHLAIGLGGWLGLMVVGTFYRIVPPMHGARVASAGRGLIILLLAGLAIAGTLAGVTRGLAWLPRFAAACSAVALLLFAWEVIHVVSRRRNRAPDLNVTHWYAVVAYSVALAGVGLAWSATPWPRAAAGRLGACVVVLFLLGWVTQAIIGQFYKVTPFLMWYYRATVPEAAAVPNLRTPYFFVPGRVVWWLSNLGVAVLVLGIWTETTLLTRVGAALVALASWVLAYALAYRWVPPVISSALAFRWRWRIS